MKIEKAYFWPRYFFESFSADERRKIKPGLITGLSRANLCLWRALNIYDDFFDGGGQPAQLPLANSYYRRFLETYYRLPLPPEFYRLFDRIMNNLDKANEEEILSGAKKLMIKNGRIAMPRRLPSFSDPLDQSRKSLPLGLNALALLYMAGASQERIKTTLNFFRLALTAKQSADDAQDWLEDLSRGLITPANALVLRAARSRGIRLDLERRPEIACLLFVSDAAAELSDTLEKLCQRTRQAAKKAGLKDNDPLVKSLIGPLESGLREAAEFRAQLAQD